MRLVLTALFGGTTEDEELENEVLLTESLFNIAKG